MVGGGPFSCGSRRSGPRFPFWAGRGSSRHSGPELPHSRPKGLKTTPARAARAFSGKNTRACNWLVHCRGGCGTHRSDQYLSGFAGCDENGGQTVGARAGSSFGRCSAAGLRSGAKCDHPRRCLVSLDRSGVHYREGRARCDGARMGSHISRVRPGL